MPRRDFKAAANAGAKPPAETGTTTPNESEAETRLDLRAQPFTMEHWGLSLPDVDATAETAHGPLDDQETRLLAEAHRAVDNARTARWMLGYALEVVRRRRLYRGDGTRTWEQYLHQEHDGLSTSEADRLQKTWRLAQTLQKELGRPLPDSHLRKLQPYAERTSDEEATRAYTALYRAHQDARVRLVADQVQQRVRKAVAAGRGVADPAQRSQAVSAAWTTAPDPVMPSQRSEDENGRGGQTAHPDPVDAAIQLLSVARQAVETATENETARKGRTREEAQRQQDAIRRIGRILSKVKVDADDIVDAEIVED